MKKEMFIINETVRNLAIEVIRNLPLDPVHCVKVLERKRNRSLESNSLYWQWLTIMGAELGEQKEAVHEQMKDMFLVTIYDRDDPEYAAMLETLREVYGGGMRDEALSLRKKIVALTSTTTATVHQMSEYMESVERHATSLSIRLPHPED